MRLPIGLALLLLSAPALAQPIPDPELADPSSVPEWEGDESYLRVLPKSTWVSIGGITPKARLHILTGPEADLSGSGAGFLLLGSLAPGKQNLVFDANEIMARRGKSQPAALHLNPKGGSVEIHGGLEPSRRVRVNGAGQVIIGRANGSYGEQAKLIVDGPIAAPEIIVTPYGWADFVLEEGYDLPSLEEVEARIAARGHLPNMPSAAEVKARGIGLADMSKRLLQQVEELTLHLIAQDKAIRAMQARLQKIEGAE